MEWLSSPEAWVALGTLTALEIVLGIDNIVFLSILVAKLPAEQQARARTLGLLLALGGRVLLLLSIGWVMTLDSPWFSAFGEEISGRDLILVLGGLFLLGKATHEIHETLEVPHEDEEALRARPATSFRSVLLQILLIDLVFSLDSVITAVGMANHVPVMIAAVVIAIVVMMFTARSVADFIQRHPTVKMLALSFLLLVGVALIAESFDLHLPRGYIYFAMAFSVFVELLNLKMRSRRKAA